MTRQRRRSPDGQVAAGPPPDTGRPGVEPPGSIPVATPRRRWWIALTAAAVLLRLALLVPAPKLTDFSDHDDAVRWGIQAADEGVLTLYDTPPPRHDGRVWDHRSNRWRETRRQADRVFDDSPGSAYLLWTSGLVHRLVSDDRLVNTITSHVLFSWWSILSDVLLAMGCAAIVALYRRPLVVDWTYGLVLFLPPLWWDSVLWGQMDSVVLAPLVWMLYFMLSDRWLAAGALWGLALALKPQAVVLAPLWLPCLLTVRPRRRAVEGLAVAAGVLLLVALPFTLHGGSAWFQSAYWESLVASQGAASGLTTLKAFNLWYADLLMTDSGDASTTWLGVTRSGWGRTLLLAGLVAVLVLILRRWRDDRRGLLLLAVGVLLALVMLPTQVHENGLILALPFVAVATVLWPRFWPALALLAVVAMAQLTWPLWLQTGPGQSERIVQAAARAHGRVQARLPAGAESEPLSVLTERQLGRYRLGRADSLGCELLLVLLALSAAAMAAATLVRVTPHSGIPPPSAERSLAWLRAGAVVLFLSAAAYGVLEVHASGDTWIGLAAGREIASSPDFPVADTFSYTFQGETWFNQNWLSHLFFWMLYRHLGDNAPVFGTWTLGVGIFLLVLGAARLRSRSWLLATVAAASVAAASRGWLSIRPATVQLLLLAALSLALHALLAQRERRRWWPVAVIGAVLAIWAHAHGSFVFAYGIVALFLGCAVVPRGLGRRVTIGDAQWLAIVAVVLLTAVLGAVLSPYGLDNYTHPMKVTSSDIFRQVDEWRPPWFPGAYPPVLSFWLLLGAAVVGPVAALALGRLGAARAEGSAREAAGPVALHQLLYDVASLGVGLAMALWARRFAPIFLIFGAPVVVAVIARLARPMAPSVRSRVRQVAVGAAWLGAAVAASAAWGKGYRDLFADPSANVPGRSPALIERVTETYGIPWPAIDLVRRNRLGANVITDWRMGGAMMFNAPTAKVFIDGRSQQLYSEQHFLSYVALIRIPRDRADVASAILDRHGTEMVLLPRWPEMESLIHILDGTRDWLPVLLEPGSATFVRRGCELLAELGRRERAGELWWPDLPEAMAGRGALLYATEPVDVEAARELWTRAIARKPDLGLRYYQPLTAATLALGEHEEALAYLEGERARLSSRGNQDLLRVIERCEEMVEQHR